jgi:hypothetical protein
MLIHVTFWNFSTTPKQFTAGMSLVDSLDSIFMLYAYLGPEAYQSVKSTNWRLLERKNRIIDTLVVGEIDHEIVNIYEGIAQEELSHTNPPKREKVDDTKDNVTIPDKTAGNEVNDSQAYAGEESVDREQAVQRKTQAMSELSIVLMAMSIAVALR